MNLPYFLFSCHFIWKIFLNSGKSNAEFVQNKRHFVFTLCTCCVHCTVFFNNSCLNLKKKERWIFFPQLFCPLFLWSYLCFLFFYFISTHSNLLKAWCTLTLYGIDNFLRHFKVYVQVLEKAETDTERFAALFLVPKLVKTGDCDKKARMHLVEAIGYSFLGKDYYYT